MKMTIVMMATLCVLLVACGTQNLGGEAVKIRCTDSDGGYNIYLKGTVMVANKAYTDSCSGVMLTEYYCSANYPKSQVYTCSYGCQNGACANAPPPPPASCADSDGGLNYYTAGFVNSTNGTYVDSCSGATLSERYCNGNYPATQTYNCPYGCQNNACANAPPPPPQTCYDSDGGVVPATSGYVVTMQNGTNYTNPDLCVNAMLLREWYCNGASAANIYYNCTRNCTAGAC